MNIIINVCSLVQAEYWHDPYNMEKYRKDCDFLPDINQENVSLCTVPVLMGQPNPTQPNPTQFIACDVHSYWLRSAYI